MANKPIMKSVFGLPSPEVTRRIETDEQVSRAHEAHYRLEIKMAELKAQFEQKASELRCTFLAEMAEILGPAEEDR